MRFAGGSQVLSSPGGSELRVDLKSEPPVTVAVSLVGKFGRTQSDSENELNARHALPFWLQTKDPGPAEGLHDQHSSYDGRRQVYHHLGW